MMAFSKKRTDSKSVNGGPSFKENWWWIGRQRRKMRKEETVTVDLLHRAVMAKDTAEGLCERVGTGNL